MGYTQFPGQRIVYTPQEYAWARRRPAPDRTPIPEVDEDVFYRHVECGPVTRATVLAVQSLEDFTDPNLWYFQTDEFNEPVYIDGEMILAQAFDPWPTLTLRTQYGIGITREARLREAPGWLPLNWETRYRPQPQIRLVRNGGE